MATSIEKNLPLYTWHCTWDDRNANEREVYKALMDYLDARHIEVHGSCSCPEPEDLKDDEFMLCMEGPECVLGVTPSRSRDLVDGFIREHMIGRGWLAAFHEKEVSGDVVSIEDFLPKGEKNEDND